MASSLTTSTTRDSAPGGVQCQRASRPQRYRSLGVVAALLLIVVFAAGCDWLQPEFDGGQSNFNAVEPALTASTVGSLTKQFSVPIQGRDGGPVVVDGKIAYSKLDSAGNLAVTTVNAGTGAPGWTTTLSELKGGGTGVASDGTNIYVAGQEAAGPPTQGGAGHVIALSAATGAIVWDVNLGPGGIAIATPEVAGGRLFVLRASGGPSSASFLLTAFDTATGSTLWNYLTQSFFGAGVIAGTTATADDSVALTASNGTTILNAADGSVRWSSASLPAGQTAALYAGGSGMFFGLYGPSICIACNPPRDHLAAVDATTGAIKWVTTAEASMMNPEAITNNRLIRVAPSSSVPGVDELDALDITTGLVQWATSFPAGASFASEAVVAGNLIYVVTSDGTTATLRTYDLTTGVAVSTTPLSSSSFLPQPIVAEGHVYLVSPNSIDAYAPAS